MNSDFLRIWGPGQILAFSGLDGQTDFENGIVMRTAFEGAGFDIRIPENGGTVRFSDSVLKENTLILSGDFFMAGDVKAAFVDAHHLLLQGEMEVSAVNNISVFRDEDKILLGHVKGFNPGLIESDLDSIIAKRRQQLLAWPFPNNISEISRQTLAKAYSQLRTQVYAPQDEIKHYWTTPDRWPHRMMWLWDSVFHAIGIRHVDPELAHEALMAVLDIQREDGFIAHCAAPNTRSDITQPPVLALGVKLVNEVSPSPDWIQEVYPKLKAYIEWNFANRDTDGAGLLEWYIHSTVNCRSGESGMDNSPRFDSATQLDATDFNAYMALECEILAEFADELGIVEDAAYWRNHHSRLNELINSRLWNADRNFYFDYDVTKNQRSKVMASSGFLPLICGAPSEQQAAELVKHLDNPQTFKTELPVASISIDDVDSYSKDMWRGPVWVNINWLIAYGLKRYGFHCQAEKIINCTLAEIERMYMRYGTIFEFFDDRREIDPPQLLRKMKNIPDTGHQVFHDYGWSATLYVDMLFDNAKKERTNHETH